MDVTGALKFHCTSAVAVDAADHRISLALRHENGEIAMEVPASFMDGATYPVVIDPWFGTNGSNTGGGISNTASASERPAMRGNVIAWADNSIGNFEIYVRAWNGSAFVEFAGSASGGGISNNTGMSVNPTVIVDGNGLPVVAWEDNTGGVTTVYLRRFNRNTNAWEELGGSASKFGVPGTFFGAVHPSVGVLRGVIPGTVSVDGNGVVTSTPSIPISCPVVAWDQGVVDGNIFVSAFYPGAPAIPAFGGNQSIPSVSAGWYNLGAPNGAGVTANTDAFGPFSPGVGEYHAGYRERSAVADLDDPQTRCDPTVVSVHVHAPTDRAPDPTVHATRPVFSAGTVVRGGRGAHVRRFIARVSPESGEERATNRR